MFIKIFNLIIFTVFLSGCAQNVHFFDQYNDKKNSVSTNNTIKLYIDAIGSIYPIDGYPPGFIPSDNKDISQSLFNQTSRDPRICQNANPNSEAFYLCKTTQDNNKNHLLEWRKAQTMLWKKTAKNIFSIYKKNNNSELIFLIHGFNNTERDGKGAFTAIKTEIDNIMTPSRNPLFIEVYWDGHLGKFTGAWSRAQSSGPLVGFNLRQLFKGLDESYKKQKQPLPNIEIITHSSGAFIIGALLGNPYSALPLLQNPKDTEYSLFNKNRGVGSIDFPIPDFPSIRIGLIAAATPTTTYIGGQDEQYIDGILSKNTTLIFTMNNRDIGLGKLFRLHNLSMFGATNAGADRERYCNNLDKLNGNDLNTEVYAFDFKDHDAPFYKPYDGHGVNSYFLIKKQTNLFMKKVLDIDYSDGEKYIDLCP
jgi:hypothetical protein